jgi:hypothetical protein
VAKLPSRSSTAVRILLTKALDLLGQHHPPHIAWEKLVYGMAAGDVPYWPKDPDLAAVWKKLSGEHTPQIQHVERQANWVEFRIRGVRRTIYPIQVGLEAVWRLLPKDVRARLAKEESAKEERRHVSSVDWIIAEAQRLKRTDGIPDAITCERHGAKTAFAKLLGANLMNAANNTDASISVDPVGWKYIFNYLEKWGIWPLDRIE